MFAQAPQSFYDEPLEPGYMNALNGGTCGVNEYATYVESYSDGASSGGTASVSDTFQFTNAEKTTATENTMNFNTANEVSMLTSMQTRQYTKVTKEEWLAAIEAAWEEYKVKPMNRGGNGVLSSESPYQEPSASFLAGPIVGIVVACFAVLLCGLYVLYKKKIADQVERVKSIFACQIASNVSSLDMDDLAKEFKRIDRSGMDWLAERNFMSSFLINLLCMKKILKQCFLFWMVITLEKSHFTEFVSLFNLCQDKFEEIGVHAES
ncbi:hypothetical protein CTEN210_01156 [Chaetoceros tenuissimus]|uniref:Uncharacterized protein n=1 Tax=Chaetoceros tenuissimus TaxID=426638 RepID=A0AAD3CEK2_9STRA|nr:hypothetical protein CTEN210_01156 [Chaetoceros tenuissimus]